jgi:hypothetical protein
MELTRLAANHHELLLRESLEKIIRPDSHDLSQQIERNQMHSLYKMEIGKINYSPEIDTIYLDGRGESSREDEAHKHLAEIARLRRVQR